MNTVVGDTVGDTVGDAVGDAIAVIDVVGNREGISIVVESVLGV